MIVLLAMSAMFGTPPPSGAVAGVAPDWNHDVAPIVSARCAGCHRSGGAGPFSLLAPADLASRGDFVLGLLDSGRMPPWLVDGKGLLGDLREDRRLSSAEKSKIRRWLEAGAPIDRLDPEAVAVRAEGPDVEPITASWVTVAVKGTFEIPAESDPAWHAGEIDQRGNTLELGNRSDWRVREIRIDTGAPEAVRVASFAFDDTGAGRYLDERDPRVGFLMGGDAGLVPSGAHGVVLGGRDRLRWPDGFHQPVARGSDLVVEWHYRPTGIPETMRPVVHLDLLDEEDSPDSRPVRWLPLGIGRIQVPAETTPLVESESFELPMAVDLLGVTPRGPAITSDLELLAWLPEDPIDAPGRSVIAFRDWDHHQRETVIAEAPRRLPAGTTLRARFRLDNRSENPANPDSPAVDIRRGRRTGVLAVLVHVASAEPVDDRELAELGPTLVRGLRGRGGAR